MKLLGLVRKSTWQTLTREPMVNWNKMNLCWKLSKKWMLIRKYWFGRFSKVVCYWKQQLHVLFQHLIGGNRNSSQNKERRVNCPRLIEKETLKRAIYFLDSRPLEFKGLRGVRATFHSHRFWIFLLLFSLGVFFHLFLFNFCCFL